ncbi:hypothetical protein FHG87_002149 [Trinorchestia longiramus]|nr:hypothetical protein FHG87_002149 [Trinorchestia longiramus]
MYLSDSLVVLEQPEPQNWSNLLEKNSEKGDPSEIAKQGTVSVGTTCTILDIDLDTSHYKHLKEHLLFAKTVKKLLARAEIVLCRTRKSTLPNIVFSDEKKLDVQQKLNIKNDQLCSGTDWSE